VTAPEPAPEIRSRAPLQGRSKASLERMLATARALMLERGNEDFTLQEVSLRGKVSIGSIYLRFDGKDSLVRAVLTQAMEELTARESDMFSEITTRCRNLADFVTDYVREYSEVLRVNAPLLRLAMLRAEHDLEISALGKQAAENAVNEAAKAFLMYESEITAPDAKVSVASAHHIIFASSAWARPANQ
jgi:AcrR family transcriptional regulator